MKIALAVAASFVGLLLVGVVLHLTGVYVFGGVQRSTADYRGETSVIEKTRADGSYRIQAYERFFDACNAIAAKQATLQGLEKQLDSADPERKAWLENTMAGIEASLYSDIGDYNADASKAGTVGQFRDSSLPYTIDLNTKEPVTCS